MAPPLLCIMGPTAAGKTDLGIALAKQCNGELVSVDSALVYRGLTIGAAKPNYSHHLVDIRDPSEPYSAADFVRDAQAAIVDIRSRGRHPILIGGTMLYYHALLHGLDDIPASDPDIRGQLEARAAVEGWPALHAELARIDPELAAKLHPNHSQRIGRGLEVWQMTGRALSDWQQGGKSRGLGDRVLALAINPTDRQVLHARIAQRFESMLKAGFVDEVRTLYGRADLHRDLPAMRAVGYRQLWAWLEGEVSWEQAQQHVLAATRQLAKRQLTWLRKWPDLIWLMTDEGGALTRVQTPALSPDDQWQAVLAGNTEQRPICESNKLVSRVNQWFAELS